MSVQESRAASVFVNIQSITQTPIRHTSFPKIQNTNFLLFFKLLGEKYKKKI